LGGGRIWPPLLKYTGAAHEFTAVEPFVVLVSSFVKLTKAQVYKSNGLAPFSGIKKHLSCSRGSNRSKYTAPAVLSYIAHYDVLVEPVSVRDTASLIQLGEWIVRNNHDQIEGIIAVKEVQAPHQIDMAEIVADENSETAPKLIDEAKQFSPPKHRHSMPYIVAVSVIL
jgi:hypothetical protein